MSTYQVAKFCRSCLMNSDVRDLAIEAPEAALDLFDLTAEERELLLAGEVGELSLLGCNDFLLSYLPRWNLFGLDVPLYSERMRAVASRTVPNRHLTDELGTQAD
ncbi:hypothetical protein [Subtercola sp. YIM 133946]|uniref:hypothetical protein n=1 Tax=Subtercola sp. YIM 133946 TaxID=3118909 RepID=UPI002F92B740